MQPLLLGENYECCVFCVCVYGLSYPALKAHKPYYIVIYGHILHRSCNHCCREKTTSVTYSVFVSMASVIQHSKPISHIILQSMAIFCTVRATIVAGRKLWVLRILCLFLWPQLSSTQSPYAILYCNLWPYFAHCLINGTIFGKKLLNMKLCFDFHRKLCRKHI